MGRAVSWLYARKHCQGCQKARAFFDANGCPVGETVDAVKVRYPREAAVELAKTARRVIVGRGKTLVEVDPATLGDDELATLLLGPSGNLKAPTARVGETLVVGFNEAAYVAHLGG